ncbi:MAG TPA: hypothetical protein VG347_05545 [Verrucomicrobiae bacterium]|nr:hypothetical protein [Verrucomicrobiae bacterium]
MKTIVKQLMILSLLSLVAATGCGQSPEAEKTKADAQAAGDKIVDTAKDVAAQTKTAVQEGMQKAGVVATNVAAEASDMATNVASHVKEATTNAISAVKEKIDNVTH